jgi:hypothetical protein
VTLWEAIHRYLMEHQAIPRGQLLQRFSHDDPATVAGIVRDLVESGLVYRTGRGDATVYRAAPAEDLRQALAGDGTAAAVAFTWAAIYRDGPLSLARLLEVLPLDGPAIDRALEVLLRDGRIERVGTDAQAVYSSQRMLLPLGESAGWEAGLLNHYHAVVGGICAKLRNGQTRALPGDQLGGSTFSFDVWQGHPLETKVRSLLAEHRRNLGALWDEVSAHNQSGKPEDYTRVTFYCGQLVTDEGNGHDEAED